jgi:DNA-binding GntR family transcriptional regulator
MGEMQVWPKRRTLADEAYREVRSRIMQKILEPGRKLSIDDLSKHMNISQTPLREALARLESEGLVERKALVGYRVAPLLTREGFETLFELRLMMEPLAAKRAAERPNVHPEQFEIRPDAALPDPGGDDQMMHLDFTEADRQFHNEIAGASGDPVLADAIRRLEAHLHLHRSFLPTDGGAATEAEHQAIVDAIIDRKPIAAEAAMRRHLEAARERHRPAFETATVELAAE